MDAFTRDYIYPDLEDAGCCDYLLFRTTQGKEHLSRCHFLLNELNGKLDHYLHQDLKLLEEFLDELGSHIILLKKSSIDKLALLKVNKPELGGGSLVMIQNNLELFTNLNQYLHSTFDGRSYRGAFDGGGGDYGGGGVDDDW